MDLRLPRVHMSGRLDRKPGWDSDSSSRVRNVRVPRDVFICAKCPPWSVRYVSGKLALIKKQDAETCVMGTRACLREEDVGCGCQKIHRVLNDSRGKVTWELVWGMGMRAPSSQEEGRGRNRHEVKQT